MEQNNRINRNSAESAFEKDTESRFTLKDALFTFVNNWYWFLLSIFICVGIALFIYKIKPKIYQQSALILIREDNMSKTQEVSTLLGNGSGAAGKAFTLENEIYILRSTRLMEKVVKRLDLQPEYKYVSMFQIYEYYDDSPIHCRSRWLPLEEQ